MTDQTWQQLPTEPIPACRSEAPPQDLRVPPYVRRLGLGDTGRR